MTSRDAAECNRIWEQQQQYLYESQMRDHEDFLPPLITFSGALQPARLPQPQEPMETPHVKQ